MEIQSYPLEPQLGKGSHCPKHVAGEGEVDYSADI